MDDRRKEQEQCRIHERKLEQIKKLLDQGFILYHIEQIPQDYNVFAEIHAMRMGTGPNTKPPENVAMTFLYRTRIKDSLIKMRGDGLGDTESASFDVLMERTFGVDAAVFEVEYIEKDY